MGWQDKAIRRDAPAAGGWQNRAIRRDAPVTTPPAPPGEQYGPPMPPREAYGPPMPQDDPSFLGRIARGLRVGSQAVGAGVADLAGTPVDLTTAVLNTGLWGADKLAEALGGNVDYRIQDPVGGSNSIRNAATEALTAAFGPGAVIGQDEMTPRERVGYAAERFGAANTVGSGLISKLRDIAPRALAAPYVASGSDARVLAGDTAAGLGSGALLGAYHEYTPQYIQDKLGGIGDLIAAFGGGIGGAKLANSGEALVGKLAQAPDAYRSISESQIPIDPETALPVQVGDFKRGAYLVQQAASDPAAASEEIARYLATAGDGAHPTSALMSADPGLNVVERRLRAADPKDFIARDQAVMASATGNVRATRPEGGNQYAPDVAATRQIDEALGGARNDVTTKAQAVAQGENDLTTLADAFSGVRSLDQASRDLDNAVVNDAYLPARQKSSAMFDAAANTGAEVPVSGMRAAAEAAHKNLSGRVSPDVEAAKAFAQKYANFGAIDKAAMDAGEVPPSSRPLGDALKDRRDLATAATILRGGADSNPGRFADIDVRRDIRRGIDADIASVPEAQDALAFHQAHVAPFRSGPVSGPFFRGIDAYPNRQHPSFTPEATAGKFLVGGPASRAAAEDLAGIIKRTPDPAAATAAATDYVLSDAVRAGVIQNGKISENRLAKFMAAREGMFGQIPEIKARFDNLLQGARTGNAQVQQLTADLKASAEKLKLTEAQINDGALRLISGADPGKAVGSIFADRNPAARMKEATAAFASDPEASAGWKAAVSDWLVDKTTTAGKAGVSAGEDATSLAALDRTFKQNERALAEVFSPEEMQLLQQARTRLEVLSRKGMQASSGSATAETARGLRGALLALAGPVGTVTAVVKGALQAGSLERRFRIIAEQFPDADKAATRLIQRAMFDPRVMKLMLDFPTSDAQIYTWSAKLNQLLAVRNAATGGDEK